MKKNSKIGKSTKATLLFVLFAGIPLLFAGCDVEDDNDIYGVNDIPPAVPTGVMSVTGDAVVSVYWNDIEEADLIAYDIYRHDGDDPVYGDYRYLGSVDWDENYVDESRLDHWFDDFNVINGRTYYYAVLSVDEAGYESDLSYETVPDTPRPEGYDVWMYDRLGTQASLSGFDFSDLLSTALPWSEARADIYVEFVDGIPWIVAADSGVQLQDYGTIPLVWVDFAPRDGYSAAGRAELINGHSYIVRVADGGVHFAKFEVTAIQNDGIRIDWAYQIDEDNVELKAPAGTDRETPVATPVIVRF